MAGDYKTAPPLRINDQPDGLDSERAKEEAGRTCRTCGLWKPATDFYRKSGHHTGLSSFCRLCHRAKKKVEYRRDVESGRLDIPLSAGRICAGCHTWKPADQCYRGSRHSSGLYAYCRACNRLKQRAWRGQLTPEQKQHARDGVERRRIARRTEQPERHKELVKHANLRRAARRVGVTVEEVLRLFDEQGHCCAICGEPERRTRLCLDHDHQTGRLRGLLCHNCNHAVGKLHDDPRLLRKAARYLEHARSGGM